MLDTFEIRVETTGTTWRDQMVFLINGEDLRTLACATGLADEGMTGPPTAVAVEHPDHLLGGPDRWEDPTEPWYEVPAVLGCGCGQPGCAAVLVRIERSDDEVRWSEFKRDRDKGYLQLGPYRFDRRIYEAEIEKVSST